ncbi:MAG: cyclase family protein [Acidimicrobiales bacterium]
MAQHRAVVDFRISFTNGGSIRGEGFRLDVPRRDLAADEVGTLLVRHLGLLMVDEIELPELHFVAEAHRGSRGVDGATLPARRLVDLSHPISNGMMTYPGLPGPEISDHLTRETAEANYGPGVTFQIGRISMVANTGTYVDTPFHRFADGADLAQVGLDRHADLDGVVVRLTDRGRRGIERDELAALDVGGRAVLLHTGWDHHWRTDSYGVDAPFLTARATEWLVEQGAGLVGIDSVNIDDMGDKARPAHTGLLAAGVPIVEHLCGLDQLPTSGFRFHAAPPAVEGFGTFTVRAYAVIGN